MTQFADISTNLDQLLGSETGLATMERFPAAGTDNLVSSLVCYLYLNGSETPAETIVMTSLLTIERSEAYVNAHGLRQIDVKMRQWTAKGYSQVLGRTLEQYLAGDDQPSSEIVAEQSSADFPASVTFRAKFNVAVGGQTVIEGLDGTAHGTGWMSVPPDGDDILTVDKPIEMGPIKIVSALCAASRPV